MIASIGVHLSYPLAFAAGLVSFLSPCVFPLVPAYFAFLGGRAGRPALASAAVGVAAAAPSTPPEDGDRVPVLGNGVAFVAGFSAVFITFFYVFSALDVTLLRTHQRLVNSSGGSSSSSSPSRCSGCCASDSSCVSAASASCPHRPGWCRPFFWG